MEEVPYRFEYFNQHIVFVVKLADGFFRYNLPVYLEPEQWDDNAQLPVREVPRFDQKEYIIKQTKQSFGYALERILKYQLKLSMENLSIVWGKRLEKFI